MSLCIIWGGGGGGGVEQERILDLISYPSDLTSHHCAHYIPVTNIRLVYIYLFIYLFIYLSFGIFFFFFFFNSQ